MARYVKVVDGTVVLAVENETPLDPPWYQSDTAQIGWLYDGVVFYEPAPPPPEPRFIPTIEFLNRFSVDESVTIRASADPVVKEWVRRADDPRLVQLDLNRQEVSDSIAYLVSEGLLTQARADEILA